MLVPRGEEGRRRFLQFLAASPLWAAAGGPSATFARLLAAARTDDGAARELIGTATQGAQPIRTAAEALSVMDFEPAARQKLPPAHFGYMASGVDDDATLHANREGFAKLHLRPKRLVDVRKVDTSIRLLGETWATPIVICPTGSQKAFHPEGEIATAKAARARGHLQILSGVTTTSVEDVNAARGMPVWYQLYPTEDWNVARAIVKRAAAAGCPVLVLTVDLNGGRNLETQVRAIRTDSRVCAECHGSGSIPDYARRKPMFDGLDLSKATDLSDPSMTWEYVARVRETAPAMKIVMKGLVTAEDALLAVRYGVNGIVVSNHGGRAEESGRATIASLPEVVKAVAGRIPVLVDGGVRRGTDVYKALALGATAVGIGRPYLWGLAAFGQPGVEAVLALLRKELELVMRQMGATSIAGIARGSVG